MHNNDGYEVEEKILPYCTRKEGNYLVCKADKCNIKTTCGFYKPKKE